MKASITLREDPKPPILKAKVPLNILGVQFCSDVIAGDHDELAIGFSTAFLSGPLLKFCYRPNDSLRPFGLILKTGIGKLGSPSGSPISMTTEFGLIGNNSRPGFVLGFKSRSGDYSMRRSVESPPLDLFLGNFSKLAQNDVVKELSWDRLFSGACGVLSEGEVCARTSVIVNRVAAVKIGWSMRCPTPMECGDGGSKSGALLEELPYLVLRKIVIEHVAGDEREKEKMRGDVAEAPKLGLKRDFRCRGREGGDR